MTAVAIAPVDRGTRRSTGDGAGRRARVRVSSTAAPGVRRAHPFAPSGRPGGAPAPELRRGSLPPHLRAAITPQSRAARPATAVGTSTWRLTDRAIAIIMAGLTLLVVISFGVVVAKAVQVTSPDSGYAATR